jgi:site-specific recombinase XerC
MAPSRLGQMKLSDIRRHHINQFAADLTKAGRGAVTVRRILTRLSTILATAVKDELIPSNPAVGADRPVLHAVQSRSGSRSTFASSCNAAPNIVSVRSSR